MLWLWLSSFLDWFRPLSDEEQQYLKSLKSDVIEELIEVVKDGNFDNTRNNQTTGAQNTTSK